jgi:hypothetical protein
MQKMQPIHLSALLRQAPGKWVAVKDGELVEARETPDQLFLALRDRGIHGATIIRAPGEQEPMLVGLG